MFFFFNDTATTEIYTLSLHDALPICTGVARHRQAVEDGLFRGDDAGPQCRGVGRGGGARSGRSEEHTSELQSLAYLVCRLLLEKKMAGVGVRLNNHLQRMADVRRLER